MRTIVFAARKGGCSKTTLAAHLAVEASKRQPVTLIDADPQHSLTDWWNDRQADTPALMDAPLARLGMELKAVAGQPGLVMIDTPPLDSRAIETVIELADLVIIPVKPSPNDLRGVSATVELVQKAGKPFLFVIAQAIPRTNITDEAQAVLAEVGRVVPTVMHNRVDYAGAMTDGRTAQEIDPGGKAANEIAEVWQYIRKHLGK